MFVCPICGFCRGNPHWRKEPQVCQKCKAEGKEWEPGQLTLHWPYLPNTREQAAEA